jgi:hypothetical protein
VSERDHSGKNGESEAVEADSSVPNKASAEDDLPQLLKDFPTGPLLVARLLFVVSALSFLITLILPAFSKDRLIFRDSQASILGLLKTVAEGDGILLAAIGFLLLLLLPSYWLIATYKLCFRSDSAELSGKSIRLAVVLKRFGVFFIFILSVVLAGMALAAFGQLRPSLGAFSFLLALILLVWANRSILETVSAATLESGSSLVSSMVRKMAIAGGFLTVSTIALVIWILSVDYKTEQERQLEMDRAASAAYNRGAEDTEILLDSENHDLDRIWRGLDTSDPSFDVGNYCIRAIRGTDVSLERCLGMYIAKAEGRPR